MNRVFPPQRLPILGRARPAVDEHLCAPLIPSRNRAETRRAPAGARRARRDPRRSSRRSASNVACFHPTLRAVVSLVFGGGDLGQQRREQLARARCVSDAIEAMPGDGEVVAAQDVALNVRPIETMRCAHVAFTSTPERGPGPSPCERGNEETPPAARPTAGPETPRRIRSSTVARGARVAPRLLLRRDSRRNTASC